MKLSKKGKLVFGSIAVILVIVLAVTVILPALDVNLNGFIGGEGKAPPRASTAQKDSPKPQSGGEQATDSTGKNSDKPLSNNHLTVCVDAWIGRAPLMYANGGLETQPGSIFDKLGISVSIVEWSDPITATSAFISGDVDVVSFTLNRYALVRDELVANGKNPQAFLMADRSVGGDGIIATADIKSVRDLVGRKIAVPEFSESQTMLEYIISLAGLSADEEKTLRDGIVYVATADDAAEQLFTGNVDAACTWQPYLSEAADSLDMHVLFSTKNATNLVPALYFADSEFIAQNTELLEKLSRGWFDALDSYTSDFTALRKLSIFGTMTDAEILEMLADTQLYDYRGTAEFFNGDAGAVYDNMAQIWNTVGAQDRYKSLGVAAELVGRSAFTTTVLDGLSGEYQSQAESETIRDTVIAPEVVIEKAEQVSATIDTDALLSQKLDIHFKPNVAIIEKESYAVLDKFVETAKLLNGSIIQVEGNTDNQGTQEFNQKLGQSRAESVADYLEVHGIDRDRIIVKSNGEDKPLAGYDPDSVDGRTANRRTDVYFLVFE